MLKYFIISSLLFISLFAKGHFPFIDESKNSNFKPKKNLHVYKNIQNSSHIVNITEINFSKLDKNIEVIYIKPMNIKKFFYSSDDLLSNIMASYNYGDDEKRKLSTWISKGGILWLEAGFYASGSEIYSTDKNRNKDAILKAAKTKSVNKSFLDFPIKNVYFTLSPQQMQEVAGMNVKLLNIKGNKDFKGVNSLQINLHYFTQTYFILDGKSLLNDADGRPLATINSYGKGTIISLFPYEYRDPNFNGEDFRWKMLSLLNIDKKYYKKTKSSKRKKQAIKKVQEGTFEGYCIQLFAIQNKKVSIKQIKKASNLDVNRLERRGKYYVGRTGTFSSSKDAKSQLNIAHKKFKSAFIRKCDYNPSDKIKF